MAKDAASMYVVALSPHHSLKTLVRISVFIKATTVWSILSTQFRAKEIDYAVELVWKVSISVWYLKVNYAGIIA